jgi:hypothetical protein
MKLHPKKNITPKGELIFKETFDNVIAEIVSKYLKNVYPISRSKFGNKFKRTIIINDITYSVSQGKLKYLPTLINSISNTFAISQTESKKIIFNYFKFK